MAKDDRLYARFDIAMDEHPKIMLLSDAAFRALIECTMYSRRQLTDGFLNERVALRKWGKEVLDELSTNDDDRPSLVHIEGGWMIHDYAKHQVTSQDIEAKREAGRKGGLAKAKRNASKSLAPATGSLKQNPGTSLAKTETETETETVTSNEVTNPPSPPRGKRGTRLDPEWKPSADAEAKIAHDCPNLNYKREHAVFVDYWIAQPGQKGVKLDWDATWRNWMRRKFNDTAARDGVTSTKPRKNFTHGND